jgi:hypothetical protein
VKNNRRGQESSKRTILVTFRYSHEVNSEMANARNLAGTRYVIDRDYPYEIRTARKALWPTYKEYRSRKGHTVQLKYPLALYVNHRLVEDAFTDWELLLNPSRDICLKPPRVILPRIIVIIRGIRRHIQLNTVIRTLFHGHSKIHKTIPMKYILTITDT